MTACASASMPGFYRWWSGITHTTQKASHMPEQVDVKPGEEWLVVTCHNHSCDRPILIDPVGPEMRDDEGDLIFPADTVLVICPHCELESLYQSDEIRCEQGQQRH